MGAAQARLILALPRRGARGGGARGQGWSGETGPRQLACAQMFMGAPGRAGDCILIMWIILPNYTSLLGCAL